MSEITWKLHLNWYRKCLKYFVYISTLINNTFITPKQNKQNDFLQLLHIHLYERILKHAPSLNFERRK